MRIILNVFITVAQLQYKDFHKSFSRKLVFKNQNTTNKLSPSIITLKQTNERTYQVCQSMLGTTNMHEHATHSCFTAA